MGYPKADVEEVLNMYDVNKLTEGPRYRQLSSLLFSGRALDWRGRAGHASGADLAFVDTQSKAAARIMANPDFELDITAMRSIIRKW